MNDPARKATTQYHQPGHGLRASDLHGRGRRAHEKARRTVGFPKVVVPSRRFATDQRRSPAGSVTGVPRKGRQHEGARDCYRQRPATDEPGVSPVVSR